MGNLVTWRQERAGQAAFAYTFTHDRVDQLTAAVKQSTDPTPALLGRQAWTYDAAGNRTAAQQDDTVQASSFDSLNRLTARQAGGPLVFEGTVNEPATVTIDGQPASVDPANAFRGTGQTASGTTTVTITARDGAGNTATQAYEVDVTGGSTAYTHDANGNLTSDGVQTYQWNARNELVRVQVGGVDVATFTYDGFGRRATKTAGGVTITYVYDAEDIVEERRSTGDVVRYVHGPGIDQVLARTTNGTNPVYYLTDHLGGVVQEVDATEAVVLDREYDPWGVPVQGAATSGYAFTGREWDAEIGLAYYRARYYQPGTGRFLSEDPIGLAGGTNLSLYVGSSPTSLVDPFGLQAMSCRPQLDLMKMLDDLFGRERTDHERKAEIVSTFLPPPSMLELPTDVEGNLARFLRRLPKAFDGDVRVDRVGDDFLFSADVPGNNPGWFAVYQKLVTAAGETKDMIKTTFNPNGVVQHIKSKFP